jgi:MFS family permease
MITVFIISLLYLLIDYFFKRKNRMGLWGLINAFVALLFILTTAIYIGKFIIYFWCPYFFILAAGLLIIMILRLIQFFFFPFLFWRKKDLGPETFIEWSQIFKGKRLSLLKMHQYSDTEDCENFPHSFFTRWHRQKFFKDTPRGWHVDPYWVFEEPKPSYSRVFVYIEGYVYVICTRCKTQIKKLECKPGAMNPLDKYIIYKEDNVY